MSSFNQPIFRGKRGVVGRGSGGERGRGNQSWIGPIPEEVPNKKLWDCLCDIFLTESVKAQIRHLGGEYDSANTGIELW